MSGGIYFASKTRHAERWRTLRALGVPVISSWIDEAGPGETSDWDDLWDRCIAEASNADALILYAESIDVLKGALVEMGAALASGVPVFFVGSEGVAGSAPNHRLVTRCFSLDEALSKACKVRA